CHRPRRAARFRLVRGRLPTLGSLFAGGPGAKPGPAASSRLLATLFAFTAFSGAALLFLLEPFVGKSLLPLYGGTPAIWNTCVFFFKFILLAVYVYAHVLNRYLALPRQVLLYGATIAAAAATLPVGFSSGAFGESAEHPVAGLLTDLSRSAALPLLVVS